MKILKFRNHKCFERDLKKLEKRFPTIREDLKIMVNAQLKLYHGMPGLITGGVFEIPGLKVKDYRFFKVKKMACKSLKGRGSKTGLRVIYSFTEPDTIEFIEIYYKSDKENEDRQRIKDLYK